MGSNISFLVQFYDQQTSKRLLNLNKLGEREAVNHREALDKHIMEREGENNSKNVC